MGNRSSAPLPAVAQMQKRFGPAELQRLEAQCPPPSDGGGGGNVVARHAASISSSRSRPPLSREQFVTKFGEGMGPAMRRVLLRLFLVLDANGSGVLEYEEYLAAAFFYTKATPAERLRVLFSMYESPSSAPSSATSSASSSASTGYLTHSDVAALCAETTFAQAEINPAPPSILEHLGADGGQAQGRCPPPAPAPHPSLPQLDAAVSPFKELTSAMVDVAFAKFDADRDGRLSVAEFQQFAQHPDSGVDAVVQSLLAAPYARQVWPPSSQ